MKWNNRTRRVQVVQVGTKLKLIPDRDRQFWGIDYKPRLNMEFIIIEKNYKAATLQEINGNLKWNCTDTFIVEEFEEII